MVEILKPNPKTIDQAALVLHSGGLVAFPTETVYGLGADARNDDAVKSIFTAKGRPSFNPLIAHISDIEMAHRLVAFSPIAEKLATAFWPGPMSLVLPLRQDTGISNLVTAGLDTLAIRIPSHPTATALLNAFNGPIAAPSANLSGMLSPTEPAHLHADLLAKVDAVLENGATDVGLESTILMPTEDTIYLLREGAVTAQAVASLTGIKVVKETEAEKPRSPGQLLRHYAPSSKLVLNVTDPSDGSIHIGFGTATGDLNLSPRGDVIEAAQNLFAFLHRADQLCKERDALTITVAPIPDTDIGRAINDRLTRAANG